jgi:hypothetical protein
MTGLKGYDVSYSVKASRASLVIFCRDHGPSLTSQHNLSLPTLDENETRS